MAHQLAGVDVTRVDSSAEFSVGTRHQDANGKGYVYVVADSGGVASAGQVVLVNPASFEADLIDTTNSASAFGEPVGVSVGAITASQYGWVQVYGATTVQVAASAAANAALNTTATAGQIDDDATSGAEVVSGLVLTTANGGSAGTAAGFISNATVGATL